MLQGHQTSNEWGSIHQENHKVREGRRPYSRVLPTSVPQTALDGPGADRWSDEERRRAHPVFIPPSEDPNVGYMVNYLSSCNSIRSHLKAFIFIWHANWITDDHFIVSMLAFFCVAWILLTFIFVWSEKYNVRLNNTWEKWWTESLTPGQDQHNVGYNGAILHLAKSNYLIKLPRLLN